MYVVLMSYYNVDNLYEPPNPPDIVLKVDSPQRVLVLPLPQHPGGLGRDHPPHHAPPPTLHNRGENPPIPLAHRAQRAEPHDLVS